MGNLNFKNICITIVTLCFILIALSYLAERKLNKYEYKVGKYQTITHSDSEEACDVAGGEWVEVEDFDDCEGDCEERSRRSKEQDECIENHCYECRP